MTTTSFPHIQPHTTAVLDAIAAIRAHLADGTGTIEGIEMAQQGIDSMIAAGSNDAADTHYRARTIARRLGMTKSGFGADHPVQAAAARLAAATAV